MDKGIVLRTDPNFTFCINTQIKEQLKWLIGIGVIQPGELLPPASQLADHLKVNRNTVNLVYTQLRDEGLVSIQRGRGTEVVAGPVYDELKKKRKPMFELLERTVEEAREQGFDLYELVTASCAFVQLFNQGNVGKPRILFIECRGHDHPFYRGEVERITKAHVTSLFLEDWEQQPQKRNEALSQADAVVTTLNHAAEVKSLLAPKQIPVLTIGASADMALLLQIAKHEAGSRVAFVCLGNQGGQWMAQRVKEAGIEQIESLHVGIDQPKALEAAIKKADHVYASSAVFEEVKALAPEKVTLYPLILEKSSETLLKDLIQN